MTSIKYIDAFEAIKALRVTRETLDMVRIGLDPIHSKLICETEDTDEEYCVGEEIYTALDSIDTALKALESSVPQKHPKLTLIKS